jgi:hypothetical protein
LQFLRHAHCNSILIFNMYRAASARACGKIELIRKAGTQEKILEQG